MVNVLYGKIFGMKNGLLKAKSISSSGDAIPFKWEEIDGLITESQIMVILNERRGRRRDC